MDDFAEASFVPGSSTEILAGAAEEQSSGLGIKLLKLNLGISRHSSNMISRPSNKKAQAAANREQSLQRTVSSVTHEHTTETGTPRDMSEER